LTFDFAPSWKKKKKNLISSPVHHTSNYQSDRQDASIEEYLCPSELIEYGILERYKKVEPVEPRAFDANSINAIKSKLDKFRCTGAGFFMSTEP